MQHLKSIWLDLKDGIEAVFRREPLARNRFIQLYNDVNHYCSPREDTTSDRLPFANTDEALEYLGNELYQQVDEFLEEHVKLIQMDALDLDGEELLRYYSTQWTDYQSSSQLLNLICSQLNTDWVSRELAYGHMDIHFIYELAIVKWREHVFEAIHPQLTSAALRLIEFGSQRGRCVDFDLVRNVVSSYAELGKSAQTRPLIGPSLLLHIRRGTSALNAFTSWQSMLLWHFKWFAMTIYG